MSAGLHNIHNPAQSDFSNREVGRESAGKPGRPRVPLVERFWIKVKRGGPDDCWPWQGTRSNGYGQIAVTHDGRGRRQRRLLAHRVAWELANGKKIPRGLLVRHRCDNPPCCNPQHLLLGTHGDNIADAVARGRLAGRPIGRLSKVELHDIVERELARRRQHAERLRQRVVDQVPGNDAPLPAVLGCRELAALLRVTPSRVSMLRRAGQLDWCLLPSLGDRVFRFSGACLQDWIDGGPLATTEAHA